MFTSTNNVFASNTLLFCMHSYLIFVLFQMGHSQHRFCIIPSTSSSVNHTRVRSLKDVNIEFEINKLAIDNFWNTIDFQHRECGFVARFYKRIMWSIIIMHIQFAITHLTTN